MNPDNQTPQQSPTPEPQVPTAVQATEQPIVQPATPTAAPITPGQGGSKAMAIWSLALAILSFVVLLFFFIAGPLALAALVLGIIVLVKHKPGKGLGIAGIVVSTITLISIPFIIMLTLVAYTGISEKAKESQRNAEMRESTSQNTDSAE